MIFSAKEIPEHTKQTVNRLAEQGRLPQSVLLTGANSALRAKCSLELAKAVMCKQPKNGSPCLKCPACLKLKAETHPDFVKITPEKNRKTVSVQQTRELVLEPLYIAPNEAANKVYVFPEAQELSEVIQNTLLKTIEEPPEFVMFIFESEQREAMLSTVISRCTEFYLGQGGSKRANSEDALAGKTAEALAKAVYNRSEYGIMAAGAPLNKNRSLIKKTAAALELIVRDAMLEEVNAEALSESMPTAVSLGAVLKRYDLLKIKQVCDDVLAFCQKNANENLLCTYFTSSLAQIGKERGN